MKAKYYIGIISLLLLIGSTVKSQVADMRDYRNDDAKIVVNNYYNYPSSRYSSTSSSSRRTSTNQNQYQNQNINRSNSSKSASKSTTSKSSPTKSKSSRRK